MTCDSFRLLVHSRQNCNFFQQTLVFVYSSLQSDLFDMFKQKNSQINTIAKISATRFLCRIDDVRLQAEPCFVDEHS